MLAISIIFTLVVWFSLIPLIIAIDDVIIYRIKKTKISESAKRKLTKCYIVFIVVVYILTVWGVWLLSALLEKVVFGNYIKVIIYTLILAVLSTNSLYFSPKQEINSALDVFKNGFTKANVNNFFAQIPLNVIINLLYLIILIVAQVQDLEYCKLPEEVSYFFTMNKYGIVIVLAIQKVIKGVTPDKERAKIMLEAFVEKEKEDEELTDEIKKSFSDLKASLKQKKEKRKKVKEESKKDKEKK